MCGILLPMKIKKSPVPAPEFKIGQVWRMGEDRLQIQVVGKWLVHYRQYIGLDKKLPTRFTARGDLEQMLLSNKAVLVEEGVPAGKALNSRPARRGVKGRSSRVAGAGRRCARG